MYSFIKSGKHTRVHFKLTAFISLWTPIGGIRKDKATPKPQDPGGFCSQDGPWSLDRGEEDRLCNLSGPSGGSLALSPFTSCVPLGKLLTLFKP